jgi:hypothetical protein
MQQLVQEQEELWQQQQQQPSLHIDHYYQQQQQQVFSRRILSPPMQFVASGLPAEGAAARITSQKTAGIDEGQLAGSQGGLLHSVAHTNMTPWVPPNSIHRDSGASKYDNVRSESGAAQKLKRTEGTSIAIAAGGDEGMFSKGKKGNCALQHRTLGQQRQQQQMLQLLQEQQRRCHMHALGAKASVKGAAAAADGIVRGGDASSSRDTQHIQHTMRESQSGTCKRVDMCRADSEGNFYRGTLPGADVLHREHDERGTWPEKGQVGVDSLTEEMIRGVAQADEDNNYRASLQEVTSRSSCRAEASAGAFNGKFSEHEMGLSLGEIDAVDTCSLVEYTGKRWAREGICERHLCLQSQQQQGHDTRSLPCVLRPPWQTTTPRITCSENCIAKDGDRSMPVMLKTSGFI